MFGTSNESDINCIGWNPCNDAISRMTSIIPDYFLLRFTTIDNHLNGVISIHTKGVGAALLNLDHTSKNSKIMFLIRFGLIIAG